MNDDGTVNRVAAERELVGRGGLCYERAELIDDECEDVCQCGECEELECGPGPGACFLLCHNDGWCAGRVDEAKEHNAECLKWRVTLAEFLL